MPRRLVSTLRPLALLLAAAAGAARGQDAVVRFNEVHYNPGPGSNAVEFVELRNLLAVDVDVSNWRLDGGVAYDFPEGTVIPAHGHRVVAADPVALQAATGFAGALGPFTGNLDDNGETLRLYNNNRAFRTLPSTNAPPTLQQVWGVDIQGDGTGASNPVAPTTKSGTISSVGLGGVWNAFAVRSHAGTSVNPSLALVDAASGASPLVFAVQGTVSGYSNAVSGGPASDAAITQDYLFVNAGNSAPQIGWTLSGVPAAETYAMWFFGGTGRDIRITVDTDGDLADETSVLAPAAGRRVAGIRPSAAGVILGRAQNGSVLEGNWGGFLLYQTSTPLLPVLAGEIDASLTHRRLMDELSYDDGGDWPAAPDGSGFTLARRDPLSPEDGPEGWTWSHARHGTPGFANFALTAPNPHAVPLTARDSSPNLAHGTFSGVGRTRGGGGFEGEAFYFNGGGFIDAPVNVETTTRPRATLGAWVKVSSLTSPARHTVVSTDNGGYDRGLNVDSRQGGAETGVGRYAAFAGASAGVLGGTPATTTDGWVFLCAVYDQPSNLTRLHVGTNTFSAAHTHNASRTTLRIGAYPTLGEYFRGWIDNVFAFGRALTPAEVESIRTGGRTAIQAPGLAADLLALFEFEDEVAPDDTAAPPPAVPSVVFNESTSSTDLVFHVELLNLSTNSVDLAGWVLRSSNPLHPDSGTNTVLSAGAFLAVSEAHLGYRPADNERLFLLQPGGQTLADALRVDDTARARQPDGLGEWRRAPAPSFGAPNPAPPAAPVVIHEIFYRDTGSGAQEWIELHNPGPAAVDLSGWALEDAVTFDFAPGTSIAPGGFLVVAKYPAELAARWPGLAIVGPWLGSLANGGEEIELVDASGLARDRVHYRPGGEWPGEADGGGASLELRDARSDNALPSAWSASDTTPAGEWQTVTYRGVATDDGIGNDAFHELQMGLLDAGEVWIDDLSVVEDPDGTAIQFLQNRNFETDTLGNAPSAWRCIGTHGSHGRTRVVADPDNPANRCLLLVSTGATDDTHNKIETTYASGRTVTVGRTYEIRFRARWKSGVPLLNSRLYFNFLQRTTALGTGTLRGTPGAANSRSVGNVGPGISGVAHFPVVPAAGQAFQVTATARDPDGVASAVLRYAVNGGVPVALAMTVNGAALAAQVPGQAAGATVQFWIEATDGAGAVATWPARGAAGGAFVGVNDGLDDTTRGIHNLKLLISPAHRTQLFLNTERMSNDPKPGTLVEDGRVVYYDIGVRLKASPSGRYFASGYGYHLAFAPDRPFRGVLDTLTFERNPEAKEMLAKHMLNRAGGGCWSSYDDIVRLANPVAADSGIALLSGARTSGIFFESLYGPDAPPTAFNHELLYQPNGTVDGNPQSLKLNNPYNHTRATYELQDRGADKEAYRWGWQMAGGRRLDDYTSIVALNRAFALTGTAFDQELARVIDVEQWARTWAMMTLNGNDDVYGRLFAHNWRLYPRPGDQRLIALPWDLDRAFQMGTGDALLPGAQLARVFSAPAHLRAFRSHLLDIIHSTANRAYLTPWADHFAAKLGVSFAAHVNWVQARADIALGQLPSTVAFAITTNGGADFSTAASPVVLEGKGWIDVASITRDGHPAPAEITWISADDWRIELPLTAGLNAVTLVARNAAGAEVGRDSVNITNTAAVELAASNHLGVVELHYHPQDPSESEITAGFIDADDFQYLEVQNLSAAFVDLSGASLADAVTFAFPSGLVLGPGERAVVARNPTAFLLRHPAFPPAELLGPWTGRLARGGESLRLLALNGDSLRAFAYDDAFPWPTSPDGGGPSMVLTRPQPSDAHHADGANWRASALRHGGPGAPDATAFAGVPSGDTDADGWLNWAEFALSRTGDADPLALQLLPDGSLLLLFARNPNADAAVAVEASDDLLSWAPVSGAVRVGETWSEGQNSLEVWSVPADLRDRRYFRLHISGP